MKYTAIQIIEKRKEIYREKKDYEADRAYITSVAKYILEDRELLKEIVRNPEFLIEMCFCIVTKEKKTVPFFLNDVQKDFIQKLNNSIESYKNGEILQIKFLVLKGRQQGFTSLITAYQLACTITRKNFEGFTVADEEGNASAIFENKAKYVYTLLPEPIKPTEKYNNKKQLLFEKLNSSWEVKTASRNAGRSRTINFFHGSEAAFWKDGISSVQAALGEALTKNAIQILESTANGYNEFKSLWDSQEWKNCFYEWWKTSEYRFAFESEHTREKFFSELTDSKDWIHERCRWLIDEKKLDVEQVYWYYKKYQGYINKELIKQEYPCSPDEAFLASGKCVFEKEKIIQHKARLEKKYEKNPPSIGEFVITWNNAEIMDYPLSARWKSDPNGCIKIFEDVQSNYPYAIGGDTKGEGSDRFAATVVNNNNGKRVATLHGEMKSKYYTSQVWALGMYYNQALIGIETNFNTYPVELLTDWHYARQYQRETKDNFTGQLKKSFGFKTDGNTRPLIIEKEITLVEENIDCITDIECLNEMLSFVYDKNGRPDAESGKHDDLLFSDMICEEIRSQQSRTIENKKVEDEEDDDIRNRLRHNSFF